MKLLITLLLACNPVVVLGLYGYGHGHNHKSHPIIPPHGDTGDDGLHARVDKQHSYTSSGASRTGKNGSISGISARLVVPKVKVPKGQNSTKQFAATAWVAIDGSGCSGAGVVVGINVGVEGNNTVYQGWYRWANGSDHVFDNPIKAGDNITLSIQAMNKNSGTVSLGNLGSKKIEQRSFNDPKQALCQRSAEWMVERYSHSTLGAFDLADFTTITFEQSWAIIDGRRQGLEGANYYIMVDKKGALAVDCRSTDDATLKCDYQR